MTNIQKITLGIIFTFFSINMSGCSDGKTTANSPPTIEMPPALEMSPALASFDFDTVTEGNTSSPLEVVITNVGSQRLDVSNISISDTVNFQLDTMNGTNTCTFSPALLAGESCTIEITFIPIQFDTFPIELKHPAELIIDSNDPNTPNKTLSLTGTSVQVGSTLTVTINQVDTTTCNAIAYVSVTDQSNFPVEGLSPTDFTITEGLSAPISPISSDTVDIVTKPISIAILMDNSRSMQATDIAEMNKAATEVVLKLADADKAEIIKFDGTVYVVQEFTADKILLADAIDSPFEGSGTNTALYGALQQAILDTEIQPTERKAIIVITDGANSGSNTANLTDVINAAQAKDIPIFVIALGNFDQNIIDNVLTPIANDTSGELYEANVAQNFSTIIEQQLTEVLFIDQYILNYTSVSTGGLDVDLTIDVANSGGLTGTDNKLVTSCP